MARHDDIETTGSRHVAGDPMQLATGWTGAALVALTVALSAFVCSALTTQGGSPGMPGDEDVVMNTSRASCSARSPRSHWARWQSPASIRAA